MPLKPCSAIKCTYSHKESRTTVDKNVDISIK